MYKFPQLKKRKAKEFFDIYQRLDAIMAGGGEH
jgi:hypothetical protein